MGSKEVDYEAQLFRSFKRLILANKLKLEDEILDASIKRQLTKIGIWKSLINFQGFGLGLITNNCLVHLPLRTRLFSMFFHIVFLPSLFEKALDIETKIKFLPMAWDSETKVLGLDPELQKTKEKVGKNDGGKENSGLGSLEEYQNPEKNERFYDTSNGHMQQSVENNRFSGDFAQKTRKDSGNTDASYNSFGFPHRESENHEFSNYSTQDQSFDKQFSREPQQEHDFFNDPYRKPEQQIKDETTPDGPYSSYINQAKILSKGTMPRKND